MSFTAEEWMEEYSRTKAFVINLRSSSGSRQQLANMEQSIDKLDYRVGMMEQNPRQYGMYVWGDGREGGRERGREGGEGGSGIGEEGGLFKVCPPLRGRSEFV